MTLPADVLGFGAVLIEVTRQCVVAAVVFGCFVAGRYPRIAAPNAPDSRVGRAASASAWLAAVLRIKVEDARRAGGVDGELYVRRVRMRLACFEVWVLLSAPLAFVYRRTERKRLDRRSWFCDVLQEDGCKDERERRSRWRRRRSRVLFRGRVAAPPRLSRGNSVLDLGYEHGRPVGIR